MSGTSRGEPWAAQNVAFAENTPWARRRNLRGPDAVVGLYQEWEAVVSQLYGRYPFPKLMLTRSAGRLASGTDAHLRRRAPLTSEVELDLLAPAVSPGR